MMCSKCLNIFIHSSLALSLWNGIDSPSLILWAHIIDLLKYRELLLLLVVLLRVIVPRSWDLFSLQQYLLDLPIFGEALNATLKSTAAIPLNFNNDCAFIHVGLHTRISHILLNLILSRAWIEFFFGQFSLSLPCWEEWCVGSLGLWFWQMVDSWA